MNGVCLTACEIRKPYFTADVMAETMRKTAIGALVKGSKVNLERAMQLRSEERRVGKECRSRWSPYH